MTYVEAQFIHYHFHLVLELGGVVFAGEVAFENWVGEDLVPGYAVFLLEVEASLEEILGLFREAFSGDF